jgi:hypothetical protein
VAEGLLNIFGPTPEELEYQRKQEEELAARQDYRDRLATAGSQYGLYGGLVRSGIRQGEQLRRTIPRLFGESPSPQMERATVMQQVMNQYSGQDMSKPEVLAQMAKDLSDRGYPREAMQLMDQSKQTAARLQQANRQAQLDEQKFRKAEAEIAKLNKEAAEAGKGDKLTTQLLDDFRDKGGAVEQMVNLRASFKPEYAGKIPVFGELERRFKEMLPMNQEDREFVLWWKGYQDRINVIRNELFGSALTDPERIEFEKAMVKLTTEPELVMQYLEKAETLAKNKFLQEKSVVESQGWNTTGVEGYAPSLRGYEPAAGDDGDIVDFTQL